MRTPLAIRVPWLPSATIPFLASNVDLAPTIAALAGLPPRPADGLDLRRVFDPRFGPPPPREGALIEYLGGGEVPPWHGVRTVDFTYVEYVDGEAELYDRAGPLCHLDSRDHVRLNVETHRDLIVRLPHPRGADDAEIAEQLRAAFREFQPACQFLEDPSDIEITVVRTLVGFPIGIEATNFTLLIDYADSAAQGHHPHLFGLVPGDELAFRLDQVERGAEGLGH